MVEAGKHGYSGILTVLDLLEKFFGKILVCKDSLVL